MTASVHRRDIIRKGRVFDITVENVTFSNGFNGDMEIIRHPGASAIVPLTAGRDVLMLRQYRHATGGHLWEIPAGTFDGKEEPLTCARRELIEETGYSAQSWDALGVVTPVPGYSDERIHLFLARDLEPAAQQLDPDEILEVHPIHIDQVVSMISGGKIEDAKTIVAIFHTLQMIGGKRK